MNPLSGVHPLSGGVPQGALASFGSEHDGSPSCEYNQPIIFATPGETSISLRRQVMGSPGGRFEKHAGRVLHPRWELAGRENTLTYGFDEGREFTQFVAGRVHNLCFTEARLATGINTSCSRKCP